MKLSSPHNKYRFIVSGVIAMCFIGCMTTPKGHQYISTPGSELRLNEDRLKSEEKAAYNGDTAAMAAVYDHYAFGDYNKEKSAYWLRRLAYSGDGPSQFNLGQEFIEGGNDARGMYWIRKSANSGFEPAISYKRQK